MYVAAADALEDADEIAADPALRDLVTVDDAPAATPTGPA